MSSDVKYALFALLVIAVAAGLVLGCMIALEGFEYEGHCNLSDGSCYPP